MWAALPFPVEQKLLKSDSASCPSACGSAAHGCLGRHSLPQLPGHREAFPAFFWASGLQANQSSRKTTTAITSAECLLQLDKMPQTQPGKPWSAEQVPQVALLMYFIQWAKKYRKHGAEISIKKRGSPKIFHITWNNFFFAQEKYLLFYKGERKKGINKREHHLREYQSCANVRWHCKTSKFMLLQPAYNSFPLLWSALQSEEFPGKHTTVVQTWTPSLLVGVVNLLCLFKSMYIPSCAWRKHSKKVAFKKFPSQ